MNGPVVLGICFTLAAMLTFIFLAGDAELDELRARWEQDRADRACRRRHEDLISALRDTFPRVMKP